MSTLKLFSFDIIDRHYVFGILGIKIKFSKINFSCFVDKCRKKYPQYLSLAVIIKDEAPDFREFLEYHMLVGVEKFYVYDNESTDCIKELLEPYIKAGVVEYIFYPGKYRQLDAINDAIQRAKYKTKWLAIVDADEFIVPVATDNIPDFLKDYEKFPGVGINWMCFDSNGHKTRPDGLLIENYTRTKADYSRDIASRHIKSIVNPRMVINAYIHFCFYAKNLYTVDVNKQKIGDAFPKDSWMYKYNEIKDSVTQNFDYSKIKINHYVSKSLEEYHKRVEKGFADQPTKREFNIERADFVKDGYAYDTTILKYVEKLKKRMDIFPEGESSNVEG